MRKELKEITDFKRNHTGDPSAELGPYDVAYYGPLMDKASDEFDKDELKKYFPLDHVISTTVNIYEELLGLKINKADCQTWAEGIPCYRTYDETSQELLG